MPMPRPMADSTIRPWPGPSRPSPRPDGRVQAAGMRFNAGHALNYTNVIPIAEIEGLDELHIGHSIVSRSIFHRIPGRRDRDA